MSEETIKDVVETKETALSTEVMSLVADDIPSDHIIIPRIGLLQAMSDAVQEAGEKQGTFHNNVTNENYGETVEIIPIKTQFGALYLTNEEGLKCKSADGITNMFGDKCAECPFGVSYKVWEGKNPPKCSETFDILGVETTSMSPAVVTFKNSAFKNGKKLATQLKLTRTATSVVIGSFKDKNDKGTFFVQEAKTQKPLTPEQYAIAVKWKETFKTKTLDVEDTHE